jgi:hypothetical protein
MRHLPAALIALAASVAAFDLTAGRALATPFEPRTVPDQIQAVGHLDVDALRATQLFAAAGGQAAIDAALDHAPADVRPLARALAGSMRGISFWRGEEHGAVYVQTRDARTIARLIVKMPAKRINDILGFPTYTMDHGDHHGFIAPFGDTLVLADSTETLERSLRVLSGKAPSLSGSSKLPTVSRQGVFVFVTIGDDLLGAIQKSAHAKMLQLAIRSVALDVGETAGMVTANIHAEMRSQDAVQKAKSILDGLHAMASLSGDPRAVALHDAITVSSRGLAVEVTAKLSVGELVKLIHSN